MLALAGRFHPMKNGAEPGGVIATTTFSRSSLRHHSVVRSGFHNLTYWIHCILYACVYHQRCLQGPSLRRSGVPYVNMHDPGIPVGCPQSEHHSSRLITFPRLCMSDRCHSAGQDRLCIRADYTGTPVPSRRLQCVTSVLTAAVCPTTRCVLRMLIPQFCMLAALRTVPEHRTDDSPVWLVPTSRSR